VDIQQAMALLQGAMGPQAGANPFGALQPGMGGPMPAAAPPDYNAILQQEMVNRQAEQAAQGRLGAGPGIGAPDIQAMMAQQMANRFGAAGGGMQQIRPFGAGMQPPQQPMQQPTQPAGVATLPGGGMNGALRMRPMPGNSGPAY